MDIHSQCYRLNCLETSSPSLLTSLLAFATSSKFDHVLASCTLATIRRLADLKTQRTACISTVELCRAHDLLTHMLKMLSKQWGFTFRITHLTHTTAMSFDPSAFFIILLYLIREEGIKDLVNQLGGSRFSWPLAVLLDLCWVTNGLPSGSSPVKKSKVCIQTRGPF